MASQLADVESLLLYQSARSNEQHVVSSSLDRGADANFFVEEEPVMVRTPLRSACVQGNVGVIRTLLGRGASVFAHSDMDSWTALHSAAHGGHDHIMRLLLVESSELHESKVCSGFSLAHLIAECLNPRLADGGCEILQWTAKHVKSLDVNARSWRSGFVGWTPLHIACARGRTRCVDCLLRLGADDNLASDEYHMRSKQMHEFLAEGGEDASVKVAAGEHEEASDMIGDHYFDVGLLPIHIAAMGGHLRAVQLLLRKGQSINVETKSHTWTLLMFSIWSGNVPLVREVCRLGGRRMVNATDRRPDGSQWTPLSLAVIRCSPEMVRVLVDYGADPLARTWLSDFPGQGFIDRIALELPDAEDNHWSGPDGRISTLHLAVVRGNPEMLDTVIELSRVAHFGPFRTRMPVQSGEDSEVRGLQRALSAPSLVSRSSDSRRNSSGAAPRGGAPAPRGGAMRSLRDKKSDASNLRRRERETDVPASERTDCDPVAFCTTQGWSPAILAVQLLVVDPEREVQCELLDGVSEISTSTETNRMQVFLNLMATGRSLLEDRHDVSPPVVPQRFPEVSETLAMRVIQAFVDLSGSAGFERVAVRAAHATLCAACRFNRVMVVDYLLDSRLCDPSCRFVHPTEHRPLHIAAFCGFGGIVQLLLEHQADVLEADSKGDRPIAKLCRHHDRQVAQLSGRVEELEACMGGMQARIMELEARLGEDDG
eukprot:TRINITY_DN68808_c0_g1_i1.p1 TRINITY_DN68808_c0_g1~~TRINITY_DN68808_c0_g1_i1.p1  ORF type:complete len:713 (+),score=99.41 TRINITY_DN68808_c0_g1_i1:169-2307(+)